MIPTQLRIFAGIALLAASFAGGFAIQGWRLNAKIADLKAEHSETLQRISNEAAQSLQNAIAERQMAERIVKAADYDRAKQAQLNALQKAQLQSDLAAARKRVHVRATCPSPELPGAANPAGMDVPRAAEFDSAARQDYLDLRASILDTESELTACKAIARAIARPSDER